MSRGKVVAVGVFVALVSVTSAWAQTVSSTTGAINGKTSDESGAAYSRRHRHGGQRVDAGQPHDGHR